MRRVPELDGVRGLAILAVVVWHYVPAVIDRSLGAPAVFLLRTLRLTWSGVQLFFVLSGFLIGGILLDQRASPGYFKAFYARRVCRIFPLYFLWLALYVAILWAAPRVAAAAAGLFARPLPLASYLTFTQNAFMAQRDSDLGPNWLAITWSLAVEEQFYLFLPFLIRFTPRRWLPAAFALLAAAAPALRLALHQRREAPLFVLTPFHLDSLMLGVLCAWLVRWEPGRRWLAAHRRTHYAVFAVLLAGVAAVHLHPDPSPSAALYPWRYTWLALLFATSLLLALRDGGPASAMTRWRWLRWLGGLAYGVYLLHQGVSGMLFGLLLHREPRLLNAADLAVTLAAAAVTLAVAAASWRWFEKPLLALGHRVHYDSAPARRAATVAGILEEP